MNQDQHPAEVPPHFTRKPVVKINNFVRKHTEAVDLETLNQKGITRVNLLTFSKINELISLAVLRAFEKYQRNWNQGEAQQVQEEARAEVSMRIQAGPPPAGNGPGGPGESAEDSIAALEQKVAVEVLERRVEKLKRQLADTEESLRRVTEAKGLDPGIPSLFRDVQGLSLLDPLYTRKKDMLKIIFEDNLQLQKAGSQ